MSDTECTACGKSKPTDRFRACPDCRAEWRRYSRKPGGPAETIEALRAENTKLRKDNAAIWGRALDAASTSILKATSLRNARTIILNLKDEAPR